MNVIIGCTYQQTTYEIVNSLERIDFSPYALVATNGIPIPFGTDVPDSWWQGE